jgi:hypothetical protein
MVVKKALFWIEKLNLEKHPEGGWFKEVYRASEILSEQALSGNFSGARNISTSIYYLLENDDFSAFHRIKSDEIWHFYTGSSSIEIIYIEQGKIQKQFLGNEPDKNQNLQFVVPKNTWFAARLSEQKGYALVGCTVSPGFHFDDFELAGKELVEEYPELEMQIKNLIRL